LEIILLSIADWETVRFTGQPTELQRRARRHATINVVDFNDLTRCQNMVDVSDVTTCQNKEQARKGFLCL